MYIKIKLNIMTEPTKYTATATLNLFNGNITSGQFGGWDGVVNYPIGYAIANQQDIAGGNIRKAYVFSNQTDILDSVISFDGLFVPSNLINKTMKQLLTENKYTIFLDGTIKVNNACADALSTPPKLRISVSNEVTVQVSPAFGQPAPNLWLNTLLDYASTATEPSDICSTALISWKNAMVNLSSSNQYNFGSTTTGITINDLEKVKSIGFSFFSPTTAAATLNFNAQITYNIVAVEKNSNGTTPPVNQNLLKRLITPSSSDNPKENNNVPLIIGLSVGGLALIIIIIIIIVIAKK